MATKWRLLTVVATTAIVLLSAAPARAQVMNYSVYTDIWQSSDGQTVFGYIQVDSIDGGCGGPVDSAYSTIYSPSWRAGGSPSTSAALSYGDEDGQWTFNADLTVYCNCGGHYMQFPGGASQELARVPTYVRRIGTQSYVQGPPAPYAFVVNREILDQFEQPLQRVMFVDESFTPDPPSGNCTSLPVAQGDDWSTAGGTFGPDFYTLPGNAPNPCTSTSTQRFVIHMNSHPYQVLTTYTVTWSYSGVTLQGNGEP